MPSGHCWPVRHSDWRLDTAYPDTPMRTERLQNLADGIFAVALTLLVLNLPFLKGSRCLGHELVGQWPYYAASVVSFMTVGIVWINHHVMMDAVVKLDRTAVELNLLPPMFVAVIPWPRSCVIPTWGR